jgi:DNA-binding response OmpR family regulator
MKTNVLVIEDEPVISEMMCILLEIEGYKVICSSDTDFAKRKLKSKDVALVMLDLNLGGESGETMCRYIKEQPELQYIPVVLVSANADLKNIKEQCGADDYIAKPFELKDFVDKINYWTKAYRLTA